MLRIFFWAQGLIFLIFGGVALLHPLELTTAMGIEVGGPHGAFEMRGIYGGVSLAAGLLFLLGAFRSTLQKSALVFLLVYMAGYIFARVVATYLDGAPEPIFWGYIAFEAISAIIAFIFLSKLENQ